MGKATLKSSNHNIINIKIGDTDKKKKRRKRGRRNQKPRQEQGVNYINVSSSPAIYSQPMHPQIPVNQHPIYNPPNYPEVNNPFQPASVSAPVKTPVRTHIPITPSFRKPLSIPISSPIVSSISNSPVSTHNSNINVSPASTISSLSIPFFKLDEYENNSSKAHNLLSNQKIYTPPQFSGNINHSNISSSNRNDDSNFIRELEKIVNSEKKADEISRIPFDPISPLVSLNTDSIPLITPKAFKPAHSSEESISHSKPILSRFSHSSDSVFQPSLSSKPAEKLETPHISGIIIDIDRPGPQNKIVHDINLKMEKSFQELQKMKPWNPNPPNPDISRDRKKKRLSKDRRPNIHSIDNSVPIIRVNDEIAENNLDTLTYQYRKPSIISEKVDRELSPQPWQSDISLILSKYKTPEKIREEREEIFRLQKATMPPLRQSTSPELNRPKKRASGVRTVYATGLEPDEYKLFKKLNNLPHTELAFESRSKNLPHTKKAKYSNKMVRMTKKEMITSLMKHQFPDSMYHQLPDVS